MRLQEILYLAIRLLLAAVWLYAGVIKTLDLAQLQVDIERYRLVPPTLAWIAAGFLPALEILLGLSLVFWRRSAAPTLLSVFLLACFTLALLSAWMRGLNINCGCFGSSAQTDAPDYVTWFLRDAVLLTLAVSLWLQQRRSVHPTHTSGH